MSRRKNKNNFKEEKMCFNLQGLKEKEVKKLFKESIFMDSICQEIVNNGNLLTVSLHSNGRWSALFEDEGEYFNVFVYFDGDAGKNFVGYSFLGKE